MYLANEIATEPIRVIVADDFPSMLEAVGKCLAPGCEIIEKVTDGMALVESAFRLQADLLVTDISMSKLNGIEAVRQLRSRGLKTPVIVLTIIEDKDIANEALSAGAQGFVVKSRMGSELPTAVREVLAGRTYMSEPGSKKSSNGHKIAGC
jgi:two-component system secretion response regulator SsrB